MLECIPHNTIIMKGDKQDEIFPQNDVVNIYYDGRVGVFGCV